MVGCVRYCFVIVSVAVDVVDADVDVVVVIVFLCVVCAAKDWSAAVVGVLGDSAVAMGGNSERDIQEEGRDFPVTNRRDGEHQGTSGRVFLVNA